MNEFYAIARTYFRQVEGWHLYRSQGDKLLWLWAALVGLAVLCFWPLANSIRNSEWVMYGVWLGAVIGVEAVVLVISGRILQRKRAALIAEIAEQHAVVLESEQECRVFMLSKLLARPTDKFVAVAKEISELLKLRQEFRGQNEIEPGEFWKSIYDRDSKPRLIAVTLGAITVFTALTIRSLPDGPPLFEILSDDAALSVLRKLLVLSASIFGMLFMVRVFFGSIWQVAAIWWTRSFLAKESRTALRYMARDLVLFHKPVEVKTGAAAQVDAAHLEAAPVEGGLPHAGAGGKADKISGFSQSIQFAATAAGAVLLSAVLDARDRRRAGAARRNQGVG
jgi:hypothetical protein